MIYNQWYVSFGEKYDERIYRKKVLTENSYGENIKLCKMGFTTSVIRKLIRKCDVLQKV